jgi:hypothetical protein
MSGVTRERAVELPHGTETFVDRVPLRHRSCRHRDRNSLGQHCHGTATGCRAHHRFRVHRTAGSDRYPRRLGVWVCGRYQGSPGNRFKRSTLGKEIGKRYQNSAHHAWTGHVRYVGLHSRHFTCCSPCLLLPASYQRASALHHLHGQHSAAPPIGRIRRGS